MFVMRLLHAIGYAEIARDLKDWFLAFPYKAIIAMFFGTVFSFLDYRSL